MLRLGWLLASMMLFAAPASAASFSLTGEVTYRERIALPVGAVLTIELVDLAIPDQPRLRIAAPIGAGQVPLSFNLTLDDSLIMPAHDYALNAEIRGGEIAFRNAEPAPVEPLAQVTPVVIVTTLVAASEPSSAPPQATELPIFNIIWRAVSVGGETIPARAGVTLLVESSGRAGGNGGCNSWFSQAQVDDAGFAIGNIGSTQMACLGRMSLEENYFAALREARLWRVDNDRLVLLDSTGQTLVQFTR